MKIKEAKRLHSIQEYYFSHKLQEVRELSARGEPVINLGIGNPDLPPSDQTIGALNRSAEDPANHGYQSYRSLPALREALSDWMKTTYNVKADAGKEILPLIGSKEGITHISWAFIDPANIVLVPDPGYPTYTSVSKVAGAEVQSYNLTSENKWQIDLEELRSFDLEAVKIMWINYPHMPTGTPFEEQLLAEVIGLAQHHNFLVCHDNPYSLILNKRPRSLFEIDGAWEVGLELNSLSKSHNMAGWRLGWLTGNEKLINSVLKVKSNVDSGMFLPIQHAAIQALRNPDEWHNLKNREYKKRREAVWSVMDLLKCNYTKDQAGMFVWARIPDSTGDVEEFIDEILYEARVFITPGRIFGANGERYIRMSLCNTVETINKAKERITKMLENKKETV